MSKFGLEGFSQMVAEEVKEFGIRCNAVNPGPTRTACAPKRIPRKTRRRSPRRKVLLTFLSISDLMSRRERPVADLEAQGWKPS